MDIFNHMPQTIHINKKTPIWHLTVDRKPVNTLDSQTLQELLHALNLANSDDDVRAVTIAGANNCFSAGLDTKELTQNRNAGKSTLMAMMRKCIVALANSDVPIAAAIQGHCLGAGALFAALCDYRVMGASNTVYGMPEVKYGIDMASYVHKIFQQRSGDAVAQRFVAEARHYNANDCLNYRLVDEVVPNGDVRDCAMFWCKTIVELPPSSYFKARHLARQNLREIIKNAKLAK